MRWLKLASAAMIAVIAAFSLVGCGGQPAASSGSGSGDESSTASSAASTSSAASASTTASSSGAASSTASSAATGAADEVTIGLDYNAGTGYEWVCAAEPEGIVELTGQETEKLSEAENLSGGPLRENFTFRAIAPGEVIITFNLARSWEEGVEPAETHAYAFTVNDNLQMILNPYKSDFENEPEWKSA